MAAKLGIGNGPGGGIWRWDAAAHVARQPRDAWRDSPLLPARRLADRLGLRDVRLKLEGVNPTGSMKDRSSVTAMAAARTFRFRRVGCVSSGNMGSSIANYAARAGLPAHVFSAAYASANQVDRRPGLPICTSTTDRTTRWRPLFRSLRIPGVRRGIEPQPATGRPEDPGLRVEQLGERSPDVAVGRRGPVPGGDPRVRAIRLRRIHRLCAAAGGGAAHRPALCGRLKAAVTTSGAGRGFDCGRGAGGRHGGKGAPGAEEAAAGWRLWRGR